MPRRLTHRLKAVLLACFLSLCAGLLSARGAEAAADTFAGALIEARGAEAGQAWREISRAFPFESREMRVHGVRGDRYLRSGDPVGDERKIVSGALERLAQMPAAEPIVEALIGQARDLPDGSSEAASRRRLEFFARLCNYLHALRQLRGDPRRVERVLEEACDRPRYGGNLSAEAREKHLGPRLALLRGRWEEHVESLARAARVGLRCEPSEFSAYGADIAEVRREVARLRLRSLGLRQVVFAVREPGRDWHWYANFGYRDRDPSSKYYGAGGRLCRLDLETMELTRLVDDPDGGVRDPVVNYEADRVLFSYRPASTEQYHLYEINVDGTGLRQLTDGKYDDIEPCYLPDGRIMFCSARCKRWVPCWHSQVATLYRCDADGSNIHPVSPNVETDNTPWPMPDGRVLYTRWEYVDRSQVLWHHLWTFNPDGTEVRAWYGNATFPGYLMIDAKPIPDSPKAVATFMHGHGRNEHYGAVTVIDPRAGPDASENAVRISRDENLPRYSWHNGPQQWRDPYPLSAGCFLVARQDGLFVMDGRGEHDEIYSLPVGLDDVESDSLMVHEPQPVVQRPREPVIPDRIDPEATTGRFVLADVTRGRNMAGVEPGEVKRLLVLEVLPKPINFSGIQEPITYSNFGSDGGHWGTYFLYRVMGTVPVEPDGSAYFEVPAVRSVFFVALDEEDRSVQRMQSFCNVMPGELSGCVGCHEERSRAPHQKLAGSLMATGREPSQLSPVPDVPEVFDYPRDIQPIWDRHCVRCHNYNRLAGRLSLTGDHGPWYSHSYVNLLARGQVDHGGTDGNRPPCANGSSASALLDRLDGSHNHVKLSERERRIVRTWIDAGATYPGTYASLGTGMIWPQIDTEFIGRRCVSCHVDNPLQKHASGRYGLLEQHLNLSRPERSLLLLAPLAKGAGGLGLCGADPYAGETPGAVFADTDDPDYRTILAAIRSEAERLREMKRFDMPDFVPNEHYLREMKRYGILPADFDPGVDPADPYALDEAYWRHLWHRPPDWPGE
jgi:hypothetical protein